MKETKEKENQHSSLEDDLFAQQVDLVILNNALDTKVSHQNILIEFLNETSFVLEKYFVIKKLLEKLTYHLGFEFVAYYDRNSVNNTCSLTYLLDYKGKKVVPLNFNLELADKTFFEENESIIFMLPDSNNKSTFDHYQALINNTINNITRIKISSKDERFGTILLFNGKLENKVGDDNITIINILTFQLTQILEKIELYHESVTDELTQIYNVRYFKNRLNILSKEGLDKKTSFGLLMIDIDFFKKFNDTHGHQAGDAVLATVAQTIKNTTRKYDLAARYGGEEFCVIVNQISLTKELYKVANLIRQNIEKLTVNFEGKELKVTLSIGASLFPLHGENSNDLIKSADKALYQAKDMGRNQVQLATDKKKVLA